MIHNTAEVLSESIGENTQIWQYSVVLQVIMLLLKPEYSYGMGLQLKTMYSLVPM